MILFGFCYIDIRNTTQLCAFAVRSQINIDMMH